MRPVSLEIGAGDSHLCGASLPQRRQPVIRHAAGILDAVDWTGAYDAQPDGLLAKSCRRSI